MTTDIIWVRHSWDLNTANVTLEIPAGYIFNSASSDEEQEIVKVVQSAYGSDPIWQPIMMDIQNRMIERIRTTFATDGSDYLVARNGAEIVAVSGIAKEHWTDQNLLTGICVLPEHQRKGIGRYLLGLSLRRLKEMGLQKAQVYTESGSLADKEIYPIFGSHREDGVRYPGAG
ncbi:MAG TPA: GNAT family N-acetyltransferase [Pyrinomonadaceae bacterium]